MTEQWRKIEKIIENYLRTEDFQIEVDHDHFAVYSEYDDESGAAFELSFNITRLAHEIADSILDK